MRLFQLYTLVEHKGLKSVNPPTKKATRCRGAGQGRREGKSTNYVLKKVNLVWGSNLGKEQMSFRAAQNVEI